ncbi:MAG: hypothetical protein HY259_12735 [Chloroflexi bacterium]|nr:hypothetical protein [Chloroflexota bacterium]
MTAKRLSVFVTILALSLIFASTLSGSVATAGAGASLSLNGGNAPRVAGAAATAIPDGLINDGGFESGPQGGVWTEASSTSCEWVLDPTSIFGIPAHSGTYAWWAGGYCGVANSDGISQSVTIPAGSTTLSFWTMFYRVDADDSGPDYLVFSLNGAILGTWKLDMAHNTYPNWTQQSFDVSAWAGQTVTVQFKGRSRGFYTGNVLVDDITTE